MRPPNWLLLPHALLALLLPPNVAALPQRPRTNDHGGGGGDDGWRALAIGGAGTVAAGTIAVLTAHVVSLRQQVAQLKQRAAGASAAVAPPKAPPKSPLPQAQSPQARHPALLAADAERGIAMAKLLRSAQESLDSVAAALRHNEGDAEAAAPRLDMKKVLLELQIADDVVTTARLLQQDPRLRPELRLWYFPTSMPEAMRECLRKSKYTGGREVLKRPFTGYDLNSHVRECARKLGVTTTWEWEVNDYGIYFLGPDVSDGGADDVGNEGGAAVPRKPGPSPFPGAPAETTPEEAVGPGVRGAPAETVSREAVAPRGERLYKVMLQALPRYGWQELRRSLQSSGLPFGARGAVKPGWGAFMRPMGH